jgi:hypothetical protein
MYKYLITDSEGDLLSIQVYSASTKPEISDAIFNLPGGSSEAGLRNQGPG